MMDDEDLERALSRRLHALVDDLTPSNELTEAVHGIPGGRRSRLRHVLSRRVLSRWRVVAIPAPVAAVVAAVLVLLGGSPAVASYVLAVERDGSVNVTINEVTGVAEANARLRQLGIRTIVIVPMSKRCPAHPQMSYMGVAKRPAPRIRLVPTHLPPRTTIVLAAEQIGVRKIELAVGRVEGAVPACVSSDGTGPGLGKWRPALEKRAR